MQKTNIQIEEELLTPIQSKVTDEHNQKLMLTELKNAVFQKENAKSPGIDEPPIEF